MFSLDIIGDEEVNDILVSLVFRAAISAADFSPIDSVCAYLPCTVGVQRGGPQITEVCLPTAHAELLVSKALSCSIACSQIMLELLDNARLPLDNA